MMILVALMCGLDTNAQIDWDNPILTLDKENGLESAYISNIIQDEYGFTWILSFSEVLRFDGEKIKVLKHEMLPYEQYEDIIYDSKRKLLWIATLSGLFSYNVLTDEYREYPGEDFMISSQIFTINLQDEKLWLGTRVAFGYLDLNDYSFHRVVDERFWPMNTQMSVRDIVTDAVNPKIKWIGTSHGLLKYNDDDKEVSSMASFIDTNRYSVPVLYSDPTSGFLYIGQYYGKKLEHIRTNLSILDPSTNQMVDQVEYDPDWRPFQIFPYQDSTVLLSSHASVLAYEPGERKFEKADRSSQPESRKLQLVDAEGRLWTSNNKEVKVYEAVDPRISVHYYTAQGSGGIHVPGPPLVDHQSNKVFMPVWGGDGLYEFDLNTNKWEVISEQSPVDKPNTIKLASVRKMPSGEIVCTGGLNILMVDNGTLKKVKVNNPEGRHWSRINIDESSIWSVDRHGAFRYDLKTGEYEDFKEEMPYCSENFGSAVMQTDSRGNQWLGGLCDNVHVYDDGNKRIISHSIQPKDPSRYATGFSEWDGFLWITYSDGHLMKIAANNLDENNFEQLHINKLVEEGTIKFVNSLPMPVEEITSGKHDQDGNLWLLTKKGLILFDTKAMTMQQYNEPDGFVFKDPDFDAFVADNLKRLPDGRMMYTIRKGIVTFDPQRIQKQSNKLLPYISEIRVNDELATFDTAAAFNSTYALKPLENYIGIDMASIGYGFDRKKYKYRLAGLNDTWKTVEERNYVGYTNLKGGEYTFEMNVSDGSNTWSDYPISIAFSIAKFWYNMDWARGLFSAGSIYLLLYLYFTRVNRAIEKEKVRSEYEKHLAELKMQALTAQMNPHFIFNSLNSIDYYIIKNDSKKASHYLNRFSKLMRLILKNSRSNYVTLKEDLDALRLYLEIESLRFSNRFDYEIVVAPDIDEEYTKIPPMLIQPYVENAIWHGLLHKDGSGHIKILISMNESKEIMSCEVVDNGIGRAKSMEMKANNARSKKRKSFGMNITKDKLEVINHIHGLNAQVEIVDLQNENGEACGTKVGINLPV